MPIIDNENRYMVQSLKDSLKNAESIDILTGYFYFSGFGLLADDLKDKKVRILVGLSVDPGIVNEVGDKLEKQNGDDYDSYGVKGLGGMSPEDKKTKFEDSFIEILKKYCAAASAGSTIHGDLGKFISKLKDGTLEIKMTAEGNHAKAYILTNEVSDTRRKEPGVVFFGSSNFTYNGLKGQGEINEMFSDEARYIEYKNMFEEKWENAVPVCMRGDGGIIERGGEKILESISPSLAYKIFIRILHELFSTSDVGDFKTPSEITKGRYSDFRYQTDAIGYALDSLKKYDGVIIADVVGLGKSIIAATLAKNLDYDRVVLIVPPHIRDMWRGYMNEFGVRNFDVCSGGNIKEAHGRYAASEGPILYIIDEAHRYRNENTENYKYLHQLTRSDPGNKVILLTATPYNNRPQDLFSLVKLFQIPGKSTLNTTDNLEISFRVLIREYNELEARWKAEGENEEIREKLQVLSGKIRALISPVMIRRSRIDLQKIEEYDSDLKEQGIKLPEVVGPEILSYDLGETEELYIDTLKALSDEFEGVRYNPIKFVTDVAGFNSKYGEKYGKVDDINQVQVNTVSNIKRLIVMRFESSREAFRISLEKLKNIYGKIVQWWDRGFVPVQTSGGIDSPDDVDVESILDNLDSGIEDARGSAKAKNGILYAEKKFFSDKYIQKAKNDLVVLEKIFNDWFMTGDIPDPKYLKARDILEDLLKEDPDRKIVIFSTYADTAEAVNVKLVAEGFRCLLYTGKMSTSQKSDIVKKNFDAGVPVRSQKNDYDVIVATDALSEGFNLNRAGVVINYDIPYNPTRVVQRIGRINRINVKKFDKIYVYNFFPTDIGEENTSIKGISTLKMLLINQIVGSDTRTLTPDEDLESYFKSVYADVEGDSGETSWDVEYRNIYNSARKDEGLIKEVANIPENTIIVRNSKNDATIAYARRGYGNIFAKIDESEKVEILTPEDVLPLFKTRPFDGSMELNTEGNSNFERIKEKIGEPSRIIDSDPVVIRAVDLLGKLKFAYESEARYLNSVIEVIKEYSDLCEYELRYLTRLGKNITTSNAKKICNELKALMPEFYVFKILKKADEINSHSEIAMFMEELRNELA